jgi:hypothetical protein
MVDGHLVARAQVSLLRASSQLWLWKKKKKSTDGWREVDGWRCSTCVLSCLVVPDSEATRDAEAETDADRKSSPSMDQRHMMSAEVAPIGVLDAPASAY